MKHILFLICIVLGMKACLIEGDPVDTITPSKTKLFFSAQGGVDTVTTQGTHWEISNLLSINDKRYNFRQERDTSTGLYFPPYFFKTEDGEDIRVTKPDTMSGTDIGKIEGPWFIIDKATKQMLTIAIAPNETGKPRELGFPIDDRKSYSILITVAQAAE